MKMGMRDESKKGLYDITRPMLQRVRMDQDLTIKTLWDGMRMVLMQFNLLNKLGMEMQMDANIVRHFFGCQNVTQLLQYI